MIDIDRPQKTPPFGRGFLIHALSYDNVARLALTGFETALRLVDDVNAAFTAHDTTVAVTLLQQAE